MSIRRLAIAIAVAALAGAACSHRVDSPAVAAGAVSPSVVCVEQLTTPVALTGSGFTPLPTDTLLKPTHLVLPAIALARTEDLSGAAATGTVQLPDDPANPAASQVRWASETRMSFDVTPSLALAPGLFDVHVTNPDGKQAAAFAGALAAVPRPTLTKIAADLACDAQGDQTLVLTGASLLHIGALLPVVHAGGKDFPVTKVDGCAPLPGTHAEGAATTCTSATFVVPKAALAAGAYSVTLTNPAPAPCVSTDALSFTVVPPPSLATVTPVAVCDAQGDQTFALAGTGFLTVGAALPSVQSGATALTTTAATGCTPVAGTFAEGAVASCTGLTVVVPKGTFTAGTVPLAVTNPAPAACASTESVSLRIDAPPTVTSTVPATMCAGGGAVVVNGAGFFAGTTVSLQASGQPPIASAAATPNAAGTQLTATFGGGAAVGSVLDVVVSTEGCIDQAPHQQVHVVTGPIAFFADPEVVYDGVNTRVTVFLTSLTAPFVVTLTPTGATAPATTLTSSVVPGHPNRAQVVVPSGLAPGLYDLHVNDGTGCPTVLPQAITVTATLSVALRAVVPPFGATATETSVTILRDTANALATAPFVQTPRAFLNPSSGGTATAIPLQSVSFVDGNTLTAVVPKNQPPGVYDLIVVNPDGGVGLLTQAFTAQTAPPPVISSITPSSIVAATGQGVTVAGTSFVGSLVTASCVDATGAPLAAPAVVSGALSCSGAGCTQAATIDGSALSAGALCVVRVTNSDNSYFDYSAVGVTNSSLNLPAPRAGQSLNVARRALVAAAANATSAARFVYAIGGDGGAAAQGAPFGSVELASVDAFGNQGAWSLDAASTLGTARSFAASAVIGRYIYVAGGTNGTAALASAERAMILSPREVPSLDVDDIVPAATGLAPGHYTYRVSAVFAVGDPDNPGGESLPSDALTVRVPAFVGKKIQVSLVWTAPDDSLGAALPNVARYDLYRTPTADAPASTAVLLATVAAGGALKFTDDGTATPGTQTPLPLGSLGKWAPLPPLSSARKGAAGAAAVDPAPPPAGTQLFQFYALLGLGASGAVLTSYEHLPVTVLANGHQTVGSWSTGSAPSTAGRWQLGAWVADATTSSTIPAGSTYLFLGGGFDASNVAVGKVEAGKVAAGGDLGTLSNQKSFTSSLAGYGVAAANNQLFTFGGAGGAPSSGAKSATLVLPPPTLANNSWNSEGLTLVDARYLAGTAVQSPFIFLVGGQTASAPASTSTELVIW